MIWKIKAEANYPEHYVISSHEVWLPGNYDNERTARYAFRFSDDILYRLMEEINYKGSLITFKDLQFAKHDK